MTIPPKSIEDCFVESDHKSYSYCSFKRFEETNCENRRIGTENGLSRDTDPLL